MLLINILLIIVGLIILIAGAEGLVRGAASLASKLKISPLIIGLTVVSFGTSAPELTVNLLAAYRGASDLAIGNIVGSNIANILLILGITALIIPLTVKSSTIWKEIPLALLGVILLFIFGSDQLFDNTGFNAITRTDGLALMSLFIIFMYYIFGLARAERTEALRAGEKPEEEEIKQYSVPKSVFLTIIGLFGLVLGGRLLVDAAVEIARGAGLSEALIGLTIVGIGTSLPELATSVVAALRKQTDIAIGNVVGSNIFNVFWILGLTATIIRLDFNPNVAVDVLVAVFATLLLFLFMFVGKRQTLARWQGGLFIVLYAIYLTFLILRG